MGNSTSPVSFRIFRARSEFLATIIFALLLFGCTGGTTASQATGVTVTVSPPTASLAIGATQQFTDTVTGSSNTFVTWSVSCSIPGNPACGAISSSGLYTAPSTVSTPGDVTIVAVSQADSNKHGSATVTIRLQVLAIAASPAQGVSASAALNLVRSAGARGQGVDLHWPDLEPSPGVYDFTTANQITTIQAQGTFRIHVTLGVINTTIRQVPSDLATASWTSPQMMGRFQNMLMALLNQFGSQIDSIAIGNEVDVYLNANPAEWSTYNYFYGAASALIRTNYPSVRVGVTSTFGGATDPQVGPLVASLNSVSDLFMMNYYPLNPDYSPRDPSVVAGDFAKILAVSPNKPILLQEVGFPTSTALGSSEQLQAQFVQNVFSEWLKAGDKIPYLNFFLLHDAALQACQQIATQFGVSDPNFVLFFCSLGLRNSDGTDKQAWPALKNVAQADGFTAQP
jgi:hypothetical protein